jgi:ligand-binding sensor domain-containing protein
MRTFPKNSIAIFIILVQFSLCLAQTAADSNIIKILPSGRKEYIFTKHNISVQKNDKQIFLCTVKSEIQDAVQYHDTMWIGTTEGLYIYSIKTGVLQRSALFSDNLNISKIKIDPEGSFWIASINNGLWRFKQGKAEKLLDVSPVYSLEISNDSVIWAGSNVGLYKLNRKANSWQRYAEEGYSGYEIPDNIVENLFCDLHNNIWVIMPDEFAFIRSNDYDGHIPGFRNMATQDFQLKFITEIISYQYIFVTSKGIFLMPNSPAEHSEGQHEVKAGPEQKMYLLTNKQLLLNKDLDTKYINAVSTDKKGNLLLSYNNAVYCVKRKTIKNIVNDLSKL